MENSISHLHLKIRQTNPNRRIKRLREILNLNEGELTPDEIEVLTEWLNQRVQEPPTSERLTITTWGDQMKPKETLNRFTNLKMTLGSASDLIAVSRNKDLPEGITVALGDGVGLNLKDYHPCLVKTQGTVRMSVIRKPAETWGEAVHFIGTNPAI